MSFDLLLQTQDPSAHARVAQAIAGQPVELHATASGVVVCFSARTTDAVVQEVYAALVGLARTLGATLYDPQAGREIDLNQPNALPPGW